MIARIPYDRDRTGSRPAHSALHLAWRCDRHGGMDFLSGGWLLLTGWDFADLLGEGWLQIVHPDDRDRVTAARHAALRRQGPFELAFRVRRPDGTSRLVLDRGAPRFDTEGAFRGLVGSAADITGRLDTVTQHSQRARFGEGATLVCTACRKVAARDGTWQPLEAWAGNAFDMALHRGLCPDCEERWERGA